MSQLANKYTQPVDEFLQSIGVTMTLEGPDKVSPPFSTDGPASAAELSKFPRRKHIHGDRWFVTFTRDDGKRVFKTPFWDSYSAAELRWMASVRDGFSPHWLQGKNEIPKLADIKPSAYDVLACLTKYDPDTFSHFCDEFGYDTDSRKALALYESIQQEWDMVRRFFSSDELETLREIAV